LSSVDLRVPEKDLKGPFDQAIETYTVRPWRMPMRTFLVYVHEHMTDEEAMERLIDGYHRYTVGNVD